MDGRDNMHDGCYDVYDGWYDMYDGWYCMTGTMDGWTISAITGMSRRGRTSDSCTMVAIICNARCLQYSAKPNARNEHPSNALLSTVAMSHRHVDVDADSARFQRHAGCPAPDI
jgi:hypothetical protein